MAEYNLEEKLQQWLDGALTEEEWEQVKQSAPNREELDQWERIIAHSGNWSPDDENESMATAWAAIEQAITPKNKVIRITWWQKPAVKWAVAAAITFVIITTVVLPILRHTSISTPNSQHLSYYLPDSSLVVLNATSKISFPKRKWGENRQVDLEGEAFFNVRKGSTFQVNTNKGHVTVIGTSFNVKDREGIFSVSCSTGKVRVTVPGQPERILTPGLVTRLENNKLLPADNFKPENVGWQSGNFYFQSTPLRQVLDEMERQFDLDISVGSDVGNRLYTGFFSLGDIRVALESVCSPMDLQYTHDGEKVVIE